MRGEISSRASRTRASRTRASRTRVSRTVRDFLQPAAVLLALFLLSLWHGNAVSVRAERWREHLDAVERYARAGQWDAARAALEEGRADWSAAHAWLQAAVCHDALDGADVLYGRCAALAEAEDGLLPELAELRRALDGLADRERLSLGNIF